MDNNKNNKIDIDKDEIRDWVDSLKSLVQSRGKNIAKHIINKVIDDFNNFRENKGNKTVATLLLNKTS